MSYFQLGDGTALSVGTNAAFVVAGPDDDLVRVVSESFVSGAEVEALMTAITRRGFGDLPSFVLVLARDAGVLIVRRGDVEVRVTDDLGQVTPLPPSLVTTWREDFFEAVGEVAIGRADPGAREFWFTEGCVPAGQLRVAVAALVSGPLRASEPVGTSSPSVPESIPSLQSVPRASEDRPVLATVLGLESANHESTIEFVAAAATSTPGSTEVVAVAEESVGAAHEIDDLDFDELVNLVDHTVYRDVESAAMRAVEPLSETPAAANNVPRADVRSATSPASLMQSDDLDHDGHTVIRRPVGRPSTPMSVGAGANAVHAVLCPSGHGNPVNAMQCRECGYDIVDRAAVTIDRPVVGVLHFSTGERIAITGPAVVGRQPSEDVVVDGCRAEVVRIGHSELSRIHATLHVSEWHVHVSDSGSTNGTKVMVPGHPAEACRPQQRILLAPGTVVDLGGVVTFRFEVA